MEWIIGRPWNNHYVLVWQWQQFQIVQIMPKNVFVLIDGDKMYRYLRNKNNRNTYIPAIQMDKGIQIEILNYKYVLDWVRYPPILKSYPNNLKTDVEILNHVRQTI